ncbi:MAG: hypothetical protein G01um101470_1060 [Parcubacteria group bacterium Gr01-1014_70]|nr:MAG: hypothetical protein G01um101470_1060 [Parcubacteria group bacterium Gr01-1014_70]
MKRYHTGFIYLVVAAILVLALSAPASPSAASTHATLLESIQQQINDLVAAVGRIQARILELLAEAAKSPATIPEVMPEKKAEELSIGTTTEPSAEVKVEESTTSTEPVWKFMPLPSTYLTEPLALLYRFSITGGAKDAIIPSVTYTITPVDVSIKDLEIYAFSDELFSAPTFLNAKATKRNRVGKQVGYVDSQNQTVSILLDQSISSQITIPAGETYYFELRGTLVGKNSGAFATISAEKLPEIRLE